jgi:predicted GIY-YIG superfamily endonuclease
MPILDAHLASREETLFGNFLEGLATYVCNLTKKGYKSSAEGIDLEFTADTNHHLVTIKSGPNWGNAGQIKRMKDNFRQAKHMLGQSKHHKTIVAVNGCCYGKDDNPDKGDYLRLCGQRFWEFISGDTELYTRIIEPLGTRAKEHNDDFIRKYSQVVTLFCIGFAKEFCTPEGSIDWKHLLKTISGKNK